MALNDGPVECWATSRGTALRMLAYDATGPGASDAPAVVALHGLGVSTDVLTEAVRGLDPFARLAAEGLHVLALDWPGHGRSGGRRGHLTYRLAMDAAAAALTCAAGRWEAPVGLFGSALGGALAFYAALECDVPAVACHDVLDLRDVRAALRRIRQGTLWPAAGALARRLPLRSQERIRLPLGAIVAGTDRAADPTLGRALSRHPQSVRSYDLASVASLFLAGGEKPAVSAQRAATLIAVGSADRVMPETAARAFASQLTCPHELWVLPGGSHQLLLEHAGALLPAVAAFLRRHLS